MNTWKHNTNQTIDKHGTSSLTQMSTDLNFHIRSQTHIDIDQHTYRYLHNAREDSSSEDRSKGAACPGYRVGVRAALAESGSMDSAAAGASRSP